MPVNMDPKKRRKSRSQTEATDKSRDQNDATSGTPYEETEADREKAAADAEWKHLWDATEVIDMDRW